MEGGGICKGELRIIEGENEGKEFDFDTVSISADTQRKNIKLGIRGWTEMVEHWMIVGDVGGGKSIRSRRHRKSKRSKRSKRHKRSKRSRRSKRSKRR